MNSILGKYKKGERLLEEEHLSTNCDESKNRNKHSLRYLLKKENRKYDISHNAQSSVMVAMDFTNSIGRIVDDPKEAKAVALAEGLGWRKQQSSLFRCTRNSINSRLQIAQPWFHREINREQATALIKRQGKTDGVFLVRESRSSIGSFVLSYKSGNKVLHVPIVPILDYSSQAYVFSLDEGATKFYGLQQLVEFYQLNVGTLATRLTYCVL